MNDLEQLARDLYLRRTEKMGATYTAESIVERAFDDAEKFFAELEKRRGAAKPARRALKRETNQDANQQGQEG